MTNTPQIRIKLVTEGWASAPRSEIDEVVELAKAEEAANGNELTDETFWTEVAKGAAEEALYGPLAFGHDRVRVTVYSADEEGFPVEVKGQYEADYDVAVALGAVDIDPIFGQLTIPGVDV